MKNVVERLKNWYRNLPEKKRYVEFFTAVLSVPVMVTVIIINLNNLNQNRNQSTKSQTPTVQVVITGAAGQNNESSTPLSVSPTPQVSLTATPTATPSVTPTSGTCNQAIGPVTILSPQESEVVTKNPVCININTVSGYCPVTWAYRINGGSWSDFTDKDICLYDLTNGSKQLDVQVKSTATGATIMLQRNFTYQGQAISATPTTASSSASSSH